MKDHVYYITLFFPIRKWFVFYMQHKWVNSRKIFVPLLAYKEPQITDFSLFIKSSLMTATKPVGVFQQPLSRFLISCRKSIISKLWQQLFWFRNILHRPTPEACRRQQNVVAIQTICFLSSQAPFSPLALLMCITVLLKCSHSNILLLAEANKCVLQGLEA